MKQILFALILLVSSCSLSPDNPIVENQMDEIYTKVANDAIEQYEIAKRNGDPIQTYVQAGMVSAAYLQAKDEANYNKWKAIEKEDAKKAGMN